MAKKTENTTSIGFEEAIWKAADKLRGNLNASEYEADGVFFVPQDARWKVRTRNNWIVSDLVSSN